MHEKTYTRSLYSRKETYDQTLVILLARTSIEKTKKTEKRDLYSRKWTNERALYAQKETFVILSAKTSMEKMRNSFVMLPVLCTTVLMAGYLSTITCRNIPHKKWCHYVERLQMTLL